MQKHAWPPRRQQAPTPPGTTLPARPAPPAQQALQLEPSADEVLAEVQRIWLARPFFRRRFSSLDALLSDPQRRHVLTVCARQALLARHRAQRS
jgi:hypothetical protein